MYNKAIFWSGLEVFLPKILQLLLGLIVARDLGPEVFAYVAVITVLLSISNVIIDGGFGNALIRKSAISEEEAVTTNWIVIVLGILGCLFLYLSSGTIAVFFSLNELGKYIEVVSLVVLLNSILIVPRSILMVSMEFKKLAKTTITSSILSSLITLVLVYYGYGVWAVIAQSFIFSMVSSILLIIYSKFRPKLYFSIDIARDLFGYGSKIFISAIVDEAARHSYTAFIGYHYAASQLAFYSQADRLSQLPLMSINSVFQRVNLRVLVNSGNESIKSLTSLIFLQYMILYGVFTSTLILINEDLILFLLGQGWVEVSTPFSYLLLSYATISITSCFLNILRVKGEGGKYLKLELLKKFTLLSPLFFLELNDITTLLQLFLACSLLGGVFNIYMVRIEVDLLELAKYFIVLLLIFSGSFFIFSVIFEGGNFIILALFYLLSVIALIFLAFKSKINILRSIYAS